jgi:predicted extracellular nuclease
MMLKLVLGVSLWFALSFPAFAAPTGVRISEWMYSSGSTGPEFIEFTNFGPAPVDFTGWSFDDDSRIAGTLSLSAFGIVAPGQAVVITEGLEADFRAAWSLAPDIKVIAGNVANLGRNDEINLFDSGAILVDRLAYGDQTFPGTIRTQGRSGLPGSDAALGANNPALWVLAATGDAAGSYASTHGDIGNPGIAPAVPEPRLSALLLAGFGLLALRARRRDGDC